MARTPNLSANLNAFLDTIAVSELGAAIIAGSDDGYDVLVGSTPENIRTFSDYTAHPGIAVQVNERLVSTAAGRYQVLKRYADAYTEQLGLPDFGPQSQDRIAIQMIGECAATADIEAGNATAALLKCSSRWASLPDAQYGQHVNKVSDLLAAYASAGGTQESA